jgi:hypothetical protein
MSWIEGLVCLPDHNVDETEAILADCLKDVNAAHKIGAGLCPRVTLLYHIYTSSTQIKRIMETFNVSKAQFVAEVLPPFCLSKDNYFAVILELKSDVFVEYTWQLRAAVKTASQIKQLDRDGKDTLKYGFMPHIVLASFDSAAQMAKEAPAILKNFDQFVGNVMFLDNFKLMTAE